MDTLDSYIGKRLKSYASRHFPPAGGRSHLLKTAAEAVDAGKREGLPPLSMRRHVERRNYQSRDWTRHLIDFAMIDAFNAGVVNMRMPL